MSRTVFNLKDYKISYDFFPLKTKTLLLYDITCENGDSYEGSCYVKDTSHEKVVEYFNQNLINVLSLPKIDDDKDCSSSILYDLIEEIWMSESNIAHFDYEYMADHYDNDDIEKFMSDEVAMTYVKKGIVEISTYGYSDELEILAHGDLGNDFIRFTQGRVDEHFHYIY